ncbi:LCP family protein [Actinomycetospora endophytica]|uniref:LCP family protein n=1 Tax=Actinomycetospora endophytica TaxID=2291215 RepID=A0ABS8PDU0_9PSEU|nr:LCP family protein [Actinomycetospora endophytica]MCD2196153.1 LCP family protein [Actinomycetospora endophytica]
MSEDVDESLVPLQPGEPDRGRSARLRRGLMWVLGTVLVLVILLAGAIFAVTEHLAGDVMRVPGVFAGIDPSTRPAAGADETFLLVGTDTRSPDPTTGSQATASDFVPGAQRSDVIMLATIARDGSHASLVSIPRDSWVPIPGHGINKINAAYSFGGPALLVNTVEQLTRVRVDHFAVIDFAGFADMTDAAGGIDVTLPAATSNFGVNFPAGPQHLAGPQALAYVRQRYGLPGGDFDRVRRQQNALRSLASTAITNGTLSDPVRAYGLADALTRWVGVDDTLSNNDLRGLIWNLRGLRTSGLEFLTAPVAGTGMEGDQSVVYLDQARDNELWFAMNTDGVAGWAATHPTARLPAAPR